MNPIPGQANTVFWNAVKRADGSPITTGTVNYYLQAVTGANAGKWWFGADAPPAWNAAEQIAGAMTFVGGSEWKLSLAAAIWIDGVEYRGYGKESTNLHIPHGDSFRAVALPNTVAPDNANIVNIHNIVKSGGTGDAAAVKAVIDANLDVKISTAANAILDTIAALPAAVWNRLTSAITTAGSIGKYLLDYVVGAGTGKPTLTITVRDTDHAGALLADAVAQVYDEANVVFLREGTTGAGGSVAIIMPSNAVYKVRLRLHGHVFTLPETATVSGDTAVEFYGVAFTPGTPSPGTVRIYSWEYESDGVTPIAGAAVAAWPYSPGAYHDDGGIAYGRVHQDFKAKTVTDASGRWHLDLYPGEEYVFDLRSTRYKLYTKITTPETTTQFEELLEE